MPSPNKKLFGLFAEFRQGG